MDVASSTARRKRHLSSSQCPASVIDLSKASCMSLSHCLLGLPLSLFPSIFPILPQLLSCCLLYKHWAKTVQIHPCLTPRLILNHSVIPQLVRIAASWPLQSSLMRIYILSLYGNPILIKVAQSWECDTQSNAFEWSLKHMHKSLLNSLHFWFIVRNMIPGAWTFSETCLCCTHFFSKFWF